MVGKPRAGPWWVYGVSAVVIVGIAASIELAMGRVPTCRCGYVKLWHGIVNSSENSQHLIRDNLTLNILMLIHPFEAIKQWQLGG